MVSLDRFSGSCNALDDLSGRTSVQYETEGENLNVFNLIARINEAKTLIKHVSYSRRCKFGSKNYNSIQIIFFCCNDSVRCRRVFKPHRVSKYIEILSAKFGYFLNWC